MRPIEKGKDPGSESQRVLLQQLVDRLLEDENEEHKTLQITASYGDVNAYLDDRLFDLPEGYESLYDYPDEVALVLTGSSPGDDGEVDVEIDLQTKRVVLETAHEELEPCGGDPQMEDVVLSDELLARLREFVAENGEESLSMSWSGHGDEGNIVDNTGALPLDLLNALFEALPYGWENNEGSDGTYQFDLDEGVATLSFTPNQYERHVDEQYTWELGS